MAELKTQKTKASVTAFLNAIEDEEQRADAKAIAKLLREVTGAKPVMWGGTIVGFGSYRCTYANGKSCDWFQMGFAPRKGQLSLYVMPSLHRSSAFLKRLGKHKTGQSCLYIKRLADVDLGVLRELFEHSLAELRRK